MASTSIEESKGNLATCRAALAGKGSSKSSFIISLTRLNEPKSCNETLSLII